MSEPLNIKKPLIYLESGNPEQLVVQVNSLIEKGYTLRKLDFGMDGFFRSCEAVLTLKNIGLGDEDDEEPAAGKVEEDSGDVFLNDKDYATVRWLAKNRALPALQQQIDEIEKTKQEVKK